MQITIFYINFIGLFTNFDYGSSKNKIVYKSLKPPEYNVSRITVPTIILYSKRDNLVTKKVNEFPHIYNSSKIK